MIIDRFRLTALVTVAVAGMATGHAQQGARPAPPVARAAPAAPPVEDSRILIREGDVLEVRLGGVPIEEITQLTGQYTVDNNGYLNMPHIGKIKAAGLTQNLLQTAIENEYKRQEIYTRPTITITVPMTTRFVNVGGEVRQPQRVSFTSDLTVLSAINAAGGFTEYAAQSRVRILRGSEVIPVDIRRIRKDPSRDVPLRPGDQIEVMRSFF